MITVRLAALDDVQTILELFAMPHVAPFMRMPNADQIASKLNSTDALSLLLESDGVVVAHALVKDVGTDWRIAEFSQLLVRTQRRGYGRYFMQWVQHFVFKKRNAHRMYLETVAYNEAMRALAQASGFIQEGVFRDGFPAEDGSYADLCAYGLLAKEFDVAAS